VSRFQYLAVLDAFGPHVTPMAGVELGGRYWSTTSATAAKVRALRSDDRAAVLEVDGTGWFLSRGTATVLDARRPLDAVDDPVAIGMAGIALARLGLAHADQLAGYLADSRDVPASWRLRGRVLLAVRPDVRVGSDGHDGAWGGDGGAGRPTATRHRRRGIDGGTLDTLADDARRLVTSHRRCVVGLVTADGPVVLPAHWNPAGSVTVDRGLLQRSGATLPGRCAVTIDDSEHRRPTAKSGVMLRGDAEVLAARADTPLFAQDLTVRVQRAATWSGFDVTTRQAS
jgi:hypothetical protein